MLWIEYNGSGVPKDVAQKAVADIAILVAGLPVAAVDWRHKGFGVIAAVEDYDSCSLQSLHVNSQELAPKSTNTDEANLSILQTAEGRTSDQTDNTPSEFIAYLKLETPQIKQSLKIAFETTVTHSSGRELETEITLNPVTIEAFPVQAPGQPARNQSPSTSAKHSRFTTDQVTISVGLDGGNNKLREFSPREHHFRVNASNGLPMDPPQYIDLCPRYEGSSEGSQSWKYKVKRGHLHKRLECSKDSPPCHSATFSYVDNNAPCELYMGVRSDFKLAKPRSLTLTDMIQSGSLQPNLRHISLELKAVMVNCGIGKTFEYPNQCKSGGRIDVEMKFERAIGNGVPQTNCT